MMFPKPRPVPTPYDGPLRWLVPSSSNPGESHMVELNAYGVNGRCSCNDFTCRHEPMLRSNPVLGGVDKTRCKHIRLVRQHFLDTLIKELAQGTLVFLFVFASWGRLTATPTDAFLDSLAWAESKNDPKALGDYSFGQPQARGAYQQHLGAWLDADAVRLAKGLPRASWVGGSLCPVASRGYALTYLEILEQKIKALGLQPTPERLWLAWSMGFAGAKRINFTASNAPAAKRRGLQRLLNHLANKPATL